MRFKISTKVISLFILLVGILGVALGYYSLKHQKETILLEFDERVKVLLSSLAVSSEYPVLIGNEKALDRIGKGILEQKDVVLCEIRNEEGEILYRGGSEKGKYCREYTFPILTETGTESTGEELILGFKEKETREIGEIYLVLSISSLIKKSNEMKKAMVVLVMIVIVSASILITILVRLILSKPINDLIRGIARISGGDLKYKVPLRSNDEIGTLAVSFNKMAEDLSKTLVSKDYVNDIISSMADSLIVTDAEGKIKTVNSAALALLGYKDEEIIGQSVDMLFRKEKEKGQTEAETAFFKSKILKDLLKNGVVSNFEMGCLTKNEKKIPVIFSGSVIKNRKGEIVNIVCVVKDITELKQAEERIKASLKEKDVLLKEIHHRVKNNMQIISSILRLQSRKIKDEEILEIFKQSQYRIKSMALIHEGLYQSEDFARIDFSNYIARLTNHLFSAYGAGVRDIDFKMEVRDVYLDINRAIPCGLIISELVSNSMKHAFPNGRKGKIDIKMHPDGKGKYILIVRDTGIEFPDGLDFHKTETLGMQIVTDLVEQLDGTIELRRNKGTKFKIVF